MYACKKKKKSAVPDLPIVLGIVYCFGLSASTEPTSRLTVHILGAHVSHIPHPKRGRLDGAAGRRAILWLETNTHANRGGVQTCPSPLHHQEGALRQSLSLSFWFLNSGSLYMALTVLELTLLQTRLASQIFLSLPPECGLKACATKPSLGQSLKGCTTKRQRR